MLHDVEAAVLERQSQELAPHLMWFIPGDAAKSWGADLEASPVMAANDPEERMTNHDALG